MTSILQYFKTRIKFAGCILLFTHIVLTQVSGITAKFSYTITNECAPTIVTLKNQSTQATGITYEWDFGKGAVIQSNQLVLQEIYTNYGQYTVKLTVSNGTETAIDSQKIVIAKGPTALFSSSVAEGCSPLSTIFTSSSKAGNYPIVSTNWDFRNGESASGITVNKTYNKAGSHSVLLKVVDSKGCFDVIESKNLINVYALPKVNFYASDSFACNAPLKASFINKTKASSNTNYTWKYGNGLSSSEMGGETTYTENGIYSITLIAKDNKGCSDSLIKKNYINIGSKSHDIGVMQYGKRTTKTILCPDSIAFSTEAYASGCKWSFSYNNKTFTYSGVNTVKFNAPDSGLLKITLHYGINSKCPGNITRTYRIDFIKSDFDFNKTYTCKQGDEIIVASKTKNTTNLKWILPDLSTKTDSTFKYQVYWNKEFHQTYSHNSNSYNFPFKLIATSKNGCSDTLIKTFNAITPVARFMPDTVSGCAPLLVKLSDSSRWISTLAKKQYIIENVTYTITDNNPFPYTFNKSGHFSIRQIVETTEGCIDTSYSITIKAGEKAKPNFEISPTSICYGDTLKIKATTDIPKNKIDSWQFVGINLFNSGTLQKSEYNTVIRTDTLGSKSIRLIVDYNGCFSDTLKENILTVKGPLGNFIDTFTCAKPFDYKFISKIKPATTLSWKIDTALITASDTVLYSFSKSGNYKVKLIATDVVSNCSLVREKTITVRKVKADFEVDSIVCFGDNSFFNAQTSEDYIYNCNKEGFLWDFGDGSPLRRTFNIEYPYTYKNYGIHFPKLIVKAENGCSDSVSKKINVIWLDASFSTDKNIGCTPSIDVKFNKIKNDKSIVKMNWDFGDYTSDTTIQDSILHTYTSNISNTFSPTLFVQDINGCYNIGSRLIKLTKADADFQSLDKNICLNEDVQFITQQPDISSYKWDFGDGNTSTTQNTHKYTKPGSYTIRHDVIIDGCANSEIKTNYISVDNADASYNMSDTVLNCFPDTVKFTHLHPSNVAEGIWAFDTLQTSNNYKSTAEYVYGWLGTYKTSLWIRTINNCEATTTQNVIVKGPYAEVHVAPQNICSGGNTVINVTNFFDTDEFRIFFGDGESSTQNNISHKYNARGDIIPFVQLRKGTCLVTMGHDTLHIAKLRASFIFSNNNTVLCSYNPIVTNNLSSFFNASKWYLDRVNITNATQFGGVLLKEAGNHTVKLTVTDVNGCVDSISKNILSVKPTNFEITGDSAICKGKETNIKIPQIPKSRILWTPFNTLIDPRLYEQTLKPDSTTTYNISLTDSNRCVLNKALKIKVLQPFVLSRIPKFDTSISVGQHLPLNISSTSENLTYSWSPNSRISCTNCNNPTISPLNDITYKVSIKDNCFEFTEDFPVKVLYDFYIEAPKAFTPNGDGVNDEFKFETKNIGKFDLRIFNRWGNLIFTSTNSNDGWNGLSNGNKQNPDTYTYFIQAETHTGFKVNKKGTFILVK
jgi:gliding motility-associated-like protein